MRLAADVVSTPRRLRRAVKRSTVVDCAIAGCADAARMACPKCGRRVCARHAGVAAQGASISAAQQRRLRCALCRLEERRQRQATANKLWLGVTLLVTLLLIGVDFMHNHAQGIAFLGLAAALAVVAYLFWRSNRR